MHFIVMFFIGHHASMYFQLVFLGVFSPLDQKHEVNIILCTLGFCQNKNKSYSICQWMALFVTVLSIDNFFPSYPEHEENILLLFLYLKKNDKGWYA